MEWVNFKVKEGEREKLKNDAHAHRMNISEHLRWLNCYLARFVGGEAFVEVIPPHKHIIATFVENYDGGAFVECTKCGSAISADNEQEVVDKWNTRAPQKEGASNE